jgi:hypothetical protein
MFELVWLSIRDEIFHFLYIAMFFMTSELRKKEFILLLHYS